MTDIENQYCDIFYMIQFIDRFSWEKGTARTFSADDIMIQRSIVEMGKKRVEEILENMHQRGLLTKTTDRENRIKYHLSKIFPKSL